jgi:signal transduction histidine kinase/DNA-binding response OmpR family regulator
MTRILLVEDEPGHAELICRGLGRPADAFQVIVTGTLAEARRHLAREQPELILADYRLPDGRGDELVEVAGGAYPVVLLTAFGSERTAVETIKAGALDYVVKSPEMFADMPHLVRRALREWQLIQERKRAEMRLEAVNQLLLTLGPDFTGNTNRLLDLLGHELGARMALYNRIEGAHFRTIGRWQVPEDLPATLPGCGHPGGLLAPETEGDVVVVGDLKRRAGAGVPAAVQNLGLEAGLEWTIRCGGQPVGRLCVLFDRPYEFSEMDRRLLGILASALSAEENRQHAELLRARLESQLRQAQKMEAVGTLAGGIAHDFNNILTGILGNTEIARFDLPPNHPTQEALNELLRAAHRAKDLVAQILTFSRQREQQRTVVRLWPVVREALKLIRASLPATIEIQTQGGANCPAVLADPTQIHQVVMNLCTNAAQAMADKGGRLEVKLDTVMVDAEMAGANAQLRPGRYVCLSVRDTGHGMDSATLERIFEPFFTTKAPGQGTGLGLSVVHGILQNHDGAISVQSEPGAGTVFHLYFPALESAVTEPPMVAPAFPTGNGQRILFVDDEPAVVHLSSNMLQRAGYRVTGSTSPKEALGLFRSDPDNFDLVITDLTMPGLTGTALSAELLRLRPQVPIILITGFASGIDDRKARDLGIRALMQKPFSMQEMAEKVRSVLVS